MTTFDGFRGRNQWRAFDDADPWRIEAADPARRREVAAREARLRNSMGWPAYSFNPLLLNEPLKMR
jgi:hypothetical protein